MVGLCGLGLLKSTMGRSSNALNNFVKLFPLVYCCAVLRRESHFSYEPTESYQTMQIGRSLGMSLLQLEGLVLVCYVGFSQGKPARLPPF